MTELGRGKGCILSMRFFMKVMKSSVLKEPSTTMQSNIPSMEIAGRMEYLWQEWVHIQLWNPDDNVPFPPDKDLLAACTKTFKSPGPVTQKGPSIARTLVDKNELRRRILGCYPESVCSAVLFISFHSLLCYLPEKVLVLLMSYLYNYIAINILHFKTDPCQSSPNHWLRDLCPTPLLQQVT